MHFPYQFVNSMRAEICMARDEHDSATAAAWVKSESVGRQNRANTIGAAASFVIRVSSWSRGTWTDRVFSPNHRVAISTPSALICTSSRIDFMN